MVVAWGEDGGLGWIAVQGGVVPMVGGEAVVCKCVIHGEAGARDCIGSLVPSQYTEVEAPIPHSHHMKVSH